MTVRDILKIKYLGTLSRNLKKCLDDEDKPKLVTHALKKSLNTLNGFKVHQFPLHGGYFCRWGKQISNSPVALARFTTSVDARIRTMNLMDMNHLPLLSLHGLEICLPHPRKNILCVFKSIQKKYRYKTVDYLCW